MDGTFGHMQKKGETMRATYTETYHISKDNMKRSDARLEARAAGLKVVSVHESYLVGHFAVMVTGSRAGHKTFERAVL